MKKSLSILLAMIIAITNVVFITMPSVSAAAGDVLVSDNFETGYTVLGDDEAATYNSMKELCDMSPWWYTLRANENETVFNEASAVTETTPFIASVVKKDDNNMLRLTYHAEAGIGTNITNPAKANLYEYGKASYEVSFKFYATKDMKILGIGAKKEGEKAIFYRHNILTKTGSGAYMGDTEFTSPAGVGGTGINSNTWYTLKIVVNNGLGYYSVEIFDASGKSLQRVGGINYIDGCPGIANIRFQATSQNSVVYIDDYVAKKADPDELLYEDDFNIYSDFSGTTTSGANLFKEISQFRVQNTASAYALGTNDTGKYFVLNKNANAVYMPWNGNILTKASQKTRGKLQMKFSFCIDGATSPKEGASPSFRVICADNVANLSDAKYTMFRVQPFSSGDEVVYGVQTKNLGNDSLASYTPVKKDVWFNIQLTFDLENNKVTMLETKSGITFERSTGLYNGETALNSIKSVMLQATDGMVIDVDNFELKYVEKPQLGVEISEVIDFDGNRIVDEKKVNPALSTIKLTFSSPITEESANISIASSSGTVFTDYKPTYENNVCTINFTKTLAPKTTFIITVPKTVEGEDGAKLEEDWKYEFTTVEGEVKIEMTDVSIKSVLDVKNGDKIKARVKCSNSTTSKGEYLMIVGFYDENNTMIGSSYYSNNDIPARGLIASHDIGVTVPGADKLDLSKVSRVSVYLWDSIKSMIPYCGQRNIR